MLIVTCILVVTTRSNLIGASLNEPHTNRYYEKNRVHMYVCMFVAICHPHGHHATVQEHTVQVRIVTGIHVLILNKAHWTESWASYS